MQFRGGAGSGAQSNTTAFSTAGGNTNPGYTTGTQSSGLGGGSGAGGIRKHHHTADTNAEGGFLHLSTKVSNDGETIKSTLEDVFDVNDFVTNILGIRSNAIITDGVKNGDLSEVLDIGLAIGGAGAGVYRVSTFAVELWDNGTTEEPANYDKLVKPEIIGKVKTADIAIGATGTLLEVDLTGAQLETEEETGVTNLTGSIMGLNSFYKVAWDWKGNSYAYLQVDI